MIALTFGLAALAADCPTPQSPAAVMADAGEATLAWAALDEDGFRASVAKVDVNLPCLSGPLDPDQAATVHRLHGLRAFIDGDVDAARLHLASAAAADPGYKVSDRVAPDGGALRRLIDEVQGEEHAEGGRLELLDGGTVWVDGEVNGGRDESRPALVQVGERNRTTWTAVLSPGEPFAPPVAAVAGLSAPPPPPPVASPSVTDRDRRGIRPLWVAASGTGVAAAGLFGASAALRGRYDADPSQSLHNATNGTFLASTGLAAVTGGLLTAALASNRRKR